MDVQSWLRKQLEEASPDLLRVMVQDFAAALMGAEADALCAHPTAALARAGQHQKLRMPEPRLHLSARGSASARVRVRVFRSRRMRGACHMAIPVTTSTGMTRKRTTSRSWASRGA